MPNGNARSEFPNSHWTIDKRIPIALILAIVAQTGGWIWWAASSTLRLDYIESSLAEMRTTERRLTRLEQIAENQNRALDRIEEKLDRAVERDYE